MRASTSILPLERERDADRAPLASELDRDLEREEEGERVAAALTMPLVSHERTHTRTRASRSVLASAWLFAVGVSRKLCCPDHTPNGVATQGGPH
ncbi:hypothetical protein FI667_g14305, partial [Globisporangium splendens]